MKSSTRLKKGLDITSKHITATRLRSKVNQTVSIKSSLKPLITDVTRVYAHNDGSMFGSIKDHYNKVVKVKFLNGCWFEV